ncbi:helix-hairpin-helix domain-containing protein [Carnobacteriaceae bacterium zg-ZUI252]|nr:helix-hairpin-helix domain-containing protein [Carnobacteriaceae bacterium zg-ZUI252]MBS4770231.1 helix-hairpin-helix domain-containing protein [Carnobacteriaceae bacterium zg-ZUI240]QTU83411.1 helix-hairpin-helix domain-containing protein [Carnobacteriaceae bacterium zg-C25]
MIIKEMILTFVKKYAHYIALCLIVVTIFVFKNQGTQSIQTESLQQDVSSTMQVSDQHNTQKIMVDIKGAVVRGGVYEVSSNARVKDVVALAGGFLESADEQRVNLAKVVSDEMVIYVPHKNEVAENNNLENSKVNLNTATKEELMALKGIGESKANAIIQLRNSKRKFTSIDELKEIKGISEKLLNALKNEVIVR